MKYGLLFILSLHISIPFVHADALKTETLFIETSTNQTASITVEIADTDELRRIGLMGRDHIPQNTGMLFVFDQLEFPRFWMKDTKVFLDMVYINEKGIINGIHENAIPNDLTPISAPGAVKAVLEIAGGEAKRLGISKGNRVVSPLLQKDMK